MSRPSTPDGSTVPGPSAQADSRRAATARTAPRAAPRSAPRTAPRTGASRRDGAMRTAWRTAASVGSMTSPLQVPLKIAVTGAAGQIGYSLLFRLASGSLLGADRPIELRLLEIEPALKALEGVVMELDDCAFPTLAGVQIGSDAEQIFDGVSLALLVGARPRGPGMAVSYT